MSVISFRLAPRGAGASFHRIRLKQLPPESGNPKAYDPSSKRSGRPQVHSPRPWSRRLVCPLVGSCRCRLSVGSPDHVRRFPARARARYPAGYPRRPAGGAGPALRGFPLPFGRRHSLVGHPVPPGNWAFLTVGLPAQRDWTQTGFPCFARTSCDRGGALSTPGTTVLILTAVALRSASVASHRRSLNPATNIHPCGLRMTKHQPRVHAFHPSDLPLACDPRMEQSSFGFPPSFAPRDHSQRTSGRGQVIEHGPEPTLYLIDLASNHALISQCVRPRVARDEGGSLPKP